ncbi:hypothetical protein FUAX_05130 [Fulvitalea axinellae]|uniref:Uncharacterized protein n=1 Tax=Fulvitalea axinellae TaxID=1182444 RepID=A0AAU9D5J6_9BACT|nr:hypothetical protein FUAX_05130 [Fulvitalea axinellae]
MSIRSRIRKKQRRDFESRLSWNQGADREIRDWKLIDIHEIPSKINIGDEFDFWCHNKQELYLLRIRKSETVKCSVTKSQGRDTVIYLVVEFNFENLNNELIKSIIDQIEKRGVPDWEVNKINSELNIDNTM